MSVRGIRKSGNIIHVLPGLRFRFLYISFTCNDPPLIRNVEKGIMVTSKKATTFVIAFCDPPGARTISFIQLIINHLSNSPNLSPPISSEIGFYVLHK